MSTYTIKLSDKTLKDLSEKDVLKFYQEQVKDYNKNCKILETSKVKVPETFAEAKEVAQDFGDELCEDCNAKPEPQTYKAKGKFADSRLNKAFKASSKDKFKVGAIVELGITDDDDLNDLLDELDNPRIRITSIEDDNFWGETIDGKDIDYHMEYRDIVNFCEEPEVSTKKTFDVQFNIDNKDYRAFDKGIDGALEYIEGFYEPDSLEIEEEDIYNPEDDKNIVHVTITFNFKEGTSYDDYELGMDDFFISLEELGAYDIHYDSSFKETETSSNKLLNKLYTVKGAK